MDPLEIIRIKLELVKIASHMAAQNHTDIETEFTKLYKMVF